ncbi:MAG: phospho-N-acetylmuramoyl-pentapeptide-transferase [Deltaproteobacteria bacterium]|nr:phospho-N-acetylmuramoyl-pentapeptide-transferase [Deltaproteobacteria bacterium]
MLYHLLYPLHTVWSVFNVFKYITFRTIYATVTALAITLVLGPWVIRKLSRLKMGEVIRSDGPQSHFKKEGTPTMGGLLILGAVVTSTLLWADLMNRFIWMALLVTVGFGLIGFVDDYVKLKAKSGISMSLKLIGQLAIAFAVAVYLYFNFDLNTHLGVPFLKNVSPDLGWFFVIFAVFVIVGASNAVNLTDGLDGLAIGPAMIAFGTYMVFAYATGHYKIAQYLQIPFVKGSGELAIFCGAMVGAGMGFLWYNTYPAQIFMGDVGSLALGGALGTVAVVTKHEIVLAVVGGVFVMETLSVIFQVGSYRLRKKRIFRMAPIHHHFELKGWTEPKIIVRFWIISIFLALLAISTLKLR